MGEKSFHGIVTGTLLGSLNIPILQMEELRLRNKVTHLKRDRKKPMVVCSGVPHS